MPSGVSSSTLPSAFAADCRVDDFALTPGERRLFASLRQRQVRFILLGMGAALLEGVPVATQDLDVWFEDAGNPAIRDAARDAGGFWIGGFGMQPPAFGGAGLERIDIVLTAHGLDPFPVEYQRTIVHQIEGTTLHILPLERIIATKRATGRPKDLAQLPILEATVRARQRRDQ
jgi:hypothetical protein